MKVSSYTSSGLVYQAKPVPQDPLGSRLDYESQGLQTKATLVIARAHPSAPKSAKRTLWVVAHKNNNNIKSVTQIKPRINQSDQGSHPTPNEPNIASHRDHGVSVKL